MSVYNFRIDRDNREELLTRLKNNTLSMGWGGGSTNLSMLESGSLFEKYKKTYSSMTSRKFNSIMKIRNFKDNDIIIVPHLPKNGKFIIVIIDGNFPECYSYKDNDTVHLNHCIKTKKIYGLDGNLDIHNVKVHNWYAKLGWMRLPIFPLFRYKEIFVDLLDSLENDTTSILDYSQLGDYIENIKKEIRKNIKNEFNKISPSNSNISFENICKEVIISYGYKFIRHNHHKNGGDVDLIFSPQDDINNPFILRSDALYVQIKRHQGKSGKEAVEQLIKIMKEDRTESAQGCAITLGEFDVAAEELADEHDIILINGAELIDLFIDSLL